MPHTSSPDTDMLFMPGNDAATIEMKLQILDSLRAAPNGAARHVDRRMLFELGELRKQLDRATRLQTELKAAVDKVTAPPWIPAVFIGSAPTARGTQAIVMIGNAPRLVSVHDPALDAELLPGDHVYLNHEANLLIEKARAAFRTSGETAKFVRFMDERRIVIRSRDEELVVTASTGVCGQPFEPGDLVRWDRAAMVAFERITPVPTDNYRFVEDLVVSREQLGGLDDAVESLLLTLTAVLVDPDLAREFDLTGRNTVFMYGPPGCGKTLLARFCAAEIQRLTGRECHLAVVKPAEWESAYVSETEQNIRATFAALRAAARDGFTLLFLDEVESIGRIRGRSFATHHDQFLNALLTELDGFTSRGDVAVISASNRKDLIDPALLGRLSDVEIAVRRPDMKAAREIFSIHLSPDLPYSGDRAQAQDARARLIDIAVSTIYSPNGHGPLGKVTLRDGAVRDIAARDLVSGRAFEQICRAARRKAFQRARREGVKFIAEEDMRAALHEALDGLATALTPHSIRAYLEHLPQDNDVVSVEAVRRPVKRAYDYVLPARVA